MSYRFEAVITVWESGLYRFREIAVSEDSHGIREAFEMVMDKIEERLIEDEAKRRKIMEDDDIPF